MTNVITTSTTASGSFPLPIFVGIAFAIIVAIAMIFRRHGRSGTKPE